MGIETKRSTKMKDFPPKTKELRMWPDEDFAVLMGNLELLKNTQGLQEDPEGYRKKALETYDELTQYFSDYGGEFHEDVNGVYREYNSSLPLIVRRENPNLLVGLLNGQDIEMKFDPEVVAERGDKYANCALWPHGSVEKTTGIANAFLEGRGNAGPIVVVAGYKNDSEHMKIEEPEEKMLEVGNISRESVKILSGTIQSEDLEFIILRMPIKFFEKEKLTESEKKRLAEGKLQQIFRGYTFEKRK